MKRTVKRRKHKRAVYIRFFLAWGSVAVILALIIILIVSCSKKAGKSEGRQRSSDMTTQQTTETIETADTADDAESGTADAVTDETAQTETPSETAYVNDQISLDGLDGERTGWWFGGNEDEYGRSLHVLEVQEKYDHLSMNGIMPWKPGDPKLIYLTMDEGYEAGYTSSILDTLKEKHVPCVFFLTLPYAEEEPDLVRRMIDEGHQLGNHSVNHPEAIPELTVDEQYHEVTGVHDYVLEHFGYTMHLFRFPAGRYSEKSLAIVNNCNYRSIFWSYAYEDYDESDQPDPAWSLEQAVEYLHPGAIYLLHAISSTNEQILGDFIDRARAEGYEFAMIP